MNDAKRSTDAVASMQGFERGSAGLAFPKVALRLPSGV